MRRRSFVTGIAAFVAACDGRPTGTLGGTERAAPAEKGPAWVFGTVTYHQLERLPPGSELEVRLVDTTRDDDPPVVLAKSRLTNLGEVPVAFAVRYDPATIDQRRSYGVEATISVGGRPVFASRARYPVLTRGGGTRADVVVEPVAPSTAGGTS